MGSDETCASLYSKQKSPSRIHDSLPTQNDGRWSQIRNGLIIGKEIDEFKARVGEAKKLFMVSVGLDEPCWPLIYNTHLQDITLINLSGGVSAILAAVKSILLRQDDIMREIRKIKRRQREQLVRGDYHKKAFSQCLRLPRHILSMIWK